MKGWTGAFLPVSDTCTTAAGAVKWARDHQDKQVIHGTGVLDHRMYSCGIANGIVFTQTKCMYHINHDQ